MDDSPSFAIPTSLRVRRHPRLIPLQPIEVLLYDRLPQPPLLFFVLSIHGDGARVLAWQPPAARPRPKSGILFFQVYLTKNDQILQIFQNRLSRII